MEGLKSGVGVENGCRATRVHPSSWGYAGCVCGVEVSKEIFKWEIRTGSRDEAQPVRQRRVVDESVGNHDSYNLRSRAGGVYLEELRRGVLKAVNMNVERLFVSRESAR